MTTSIEKARRRVAVLEVRELARVVTRAAAADHKQARQQLEAAICAAHAAGVPVTNIAADSGFSRQWVRHLLLQQQPEGEPS